MSEKEFLKAYRKFAIDNAHISERSSYSYVTYLRNACKLPKMNNHLMLIANSGDSVLQTKYAEELCDAIDLAYDDFNCLIDPKELNNSHSAAHMLLAYVSGQQWEKYKGIKIIFTHIFSKKSLTTTFRSRLRTQDRIYDYGAFPTNLISKLATKYKVKGFWDEMIAKIKFVYDKNGRSVYFEGIERVMLGSDGGAYFEKNKKIYTIFSKNVKTGAYEKIAASKLKQLSLDHDNPLECALKDAFKSHPMAEFKKISQDILRFSKLYKQNHDKARNTEIIGEYEKTYDPVRLRVNEQALIKEAQAFIKTLSLTIMDRGHNSRKSNKVL